LRRVWPDRDGNISYLLTVCVDGRAPVLTNEIIFARLVAFLLESPARYRWFGRRFVIMPDHIHLIAHLGHEAIPLGQWMKALKAVVGGLEIRVKPNAGSGDPAYVRT
jgi:REP element-mobilizing transposase RayT